MANNQSKDRLRQIEGERLRAARYARMFHAHARAGFVEHWHWINGKMAPHERVPANDNRGRK